MLDEKERLTKIIEDAFVALRFGQDPLANETHLANEAAERFLSARGGGAAKPAVKDDETVVAALDAFERLLTYGRRPEGAGTTFKFQGGGYFFLSDTDATAIRTALAATEGQNG